MSRYSPMNYSVQKARYSKNRSTKKDFDKECHELKAQLRELYGGQCLEIIRIQEREIAIFRERLRNAGLDDTLSSSQLEQSALFRLNEKSSQQDSEFHSKFHMICEKFQIPFRIENQIRSFHDLYPISRKYNLDNEFVSEVTLLFSQYLTDQMADHFEEALSFQELEDEDMNSTTNISNSQLSDNPVSKQTPRKAIDSPKSDHHTKNPNSISNSTKDSKHITHDTISKSKSVTGLEQYKGDVNLILSEFQRICKDYSISDEAQAEILSTFVFDDTKDVHSIVPSNLKSDIYNLFKKHTSKMGKQMQQTFEKELVQILDNPSYTCRNYKSREELTSELSNLKKQIKGRILISSELQEQIRDIISRHVTEFVNEEQFELELSELLATPDLNLDEHNGILKEELTKEKLKQKLEELTEENRNYQEKIEDITSKLHDATNHPLFDNIEQAQNNLRLVNNECLNLEKLLSTFN